MGSMFTDALLCLPSLLQKTSGAQAPEGPCRPGFSQSFYSLLVSRDVLKGGGVRKGEWPISSRAPLAVLLLLL